MFTTSLKTSISKSSPLALRFMGRRAGTSQRYFHSQGGALLMPSSPINNPTPDPASKEDAQRVQDAMEVKQRELKENAATMNKSISPEDLYASPSVDFGNEYNLPHPIWKNEYVWRVEKIHKTAKDWSDKLALWTIKAIRFNFDWMSGWSLGTHTTGKAINRIIFLETVAGVPGSIAGILRHLASLRRLRRDNGWIHTLFEEAENERMHLLTYMTFKQPGRIFRSLVFLTQGVFFNFFFVAYLFSPRFCHRLVGYLEEQAVATYTRILNDIDNGVGDMATWKTAPAPEIARNYWKLGPNATMRDVVAVTRADEAHHRDVNHAFASMQSSDTNPFKPGY